MASPTTPLRLILAGGGDAPDSHLLDELFAGWLEPEGTLLYLPIASRPRADGFAPHLAWIQAVFQPLGVDKIEMWTELPQQKDPELERFSGVYLGGGNTFHLLHQLRARGFGDVLRAYALAGGPVYGGSAGAIVLGADIASCERDDANTAGLTETRGLDLLDGHDVWCHFTSDQCGQVQAYCNESGRSIYALPERGGLTVRGNQVRPAGYEGFQVFTPTG